MTIAAAGNQRAHRIPVCAMARENTRFKIGGHTFLNGFEGHGFAQILRSQRTEQLIKRATAKDPAQRFGSMQEVIEAADEAIIEQKTLFPREAETIRYVDEAMIRAVKLAEQRTDDDDDGWEPVHDVPSSPPNKGGSHVPTLGMRSASPALVESKPKLDAEVKPKVPVMAPTVELDGKQARAEALPRQFQSPALASAAAVPSPAVIPQSEPEPRNSSLSSFNLYATTNTFSRELPVRTTWFQVPLPVVMLGLPLHSRSRGQIFRKSGPESTRQPKCQRLTLQQRKRLLPWASPSTFPRYLA